MAKLVPGVNDLATLFPEVAKEADGWDPTTVTKSSGKKQKWRCAVGHPFEARPADRTKKVGGGTSCPVCAGKKVLEGVNDLTTTHPELAKEAYDWDPTTLSYGSNKKVSWRCQLGHTWEAQVNSRALKGATCPFCSGHKVLTGFNDLTTTHPVLAQEATGWDPKTVSAGSNKKLSWTCSLGHQYMAQPNERTGREQGCPVCCGRKVLAGFNDLATTHPQLAKEADGWDPSTLTSGSNKKVAWCCHSGHEWEAQVNNRTSHKTGCPVCSGKKLLTGFNDLATKFPELAKGADGWDPRQTLAGSALKLSWKCEAGHTWKAHLYTRTPPVSAGCPVCTGQKVLAGFNDLATQFPEVAAEAHGWDPKTVTPASNNKKRSWKCPKGHLYLATPAQRTSRGCNCPVCSGRQVLAGFNDLATLFPEIAAEADGWDPTKVAKASNQKKDWKCSICGHKWRALVNSRTRGSSCPECAVYGFKKNLPAWFYLLERPGEQQLGVTNYKEDRLTHHGRGGWVEVEVVGPADGTLVLETEKKLKEWLRAEVDLVPGTHENWFTAKLEVRSLAELKAKSGVETELF